MKKDSKKLKNKKNKKSEKKINKKAVLTTVIIVAVCLLVGLGIGFGIAGIKKAQRDKYLNIAFYEMEQKQIQSIQEKIVSVVGEEEIKINFSELKEADFNVKKLSSKYDLIFGWDGKCMNLLAQKAREIPEIYYDFLPTSLRKTESKKLPIMMNNYGLEYNTSAVASALGYCPESLDDFLAYVEKMKEDFFSPFIVQGADDEILLSFISCLIECFGGVESYNSFIAEYEKNSDFEALLDFKMTASKNDEFSFRDILDMLKMWSEQGFIHPNWFMVTSSDMDYFMSQDFVSSIFNSLAVHRTMTYNNVSKYTDNKFVIMSDKIMHGTIAPCVCVVNMRDGIFNNKIMNYLVTDDVQTYFSKTTTLAPVSSFSQAWDKQADNARFYAASCAGGALPSFYTALFTTKSDAGVFAEKIRAYLRK